jgi:16S rRNA processing protein RimM
VSISREKNEVRKVVNEVGTSRTGFYAVGVVAKVFGVKGEVKVHSYSRKLDEFEALDSVLVGKREEGAVRREIEKVVARGNDIYVKFRDISDRNASELLVGHFLFVEKSQRKRLASGEYFVDDFLGLEVRDSGNNFLGVVKEVLNYPAHDVYVVRAGGVDVMVPAVKEIIRSVDLKNRTMIIDPPEGLFEGKTS